jgi:hypothetical protein
MRKEPTALSGLYLEDSYFLGLLVSGTTFRVRGLFALTQDHEAYSPPTSGEQHCYREGEIALAGVQVTEWAAGKPALLSDPDGSMDLGSLGIGEREGHYQISTEWFDMICRADSLRVTLD